MNAPKKVTWLISLVLIALGIVSKFVAIPVVGTYAFWFVAVGGVLLLLGSLLKGL